MEKSWSSSVDAHLDWVPGSGRHGLAKGEIVNDAYRQVAPKGLVARLDSAPGR